MPRSALLALLFASPAFAFEDVSDGGYDLDPVPVAIDEDGVARVVGGEKVAQGDWDDAVGIVFYDSYVGCTGTLIAPNVVLTAGHCADGITGVIAGSKDWYSNQGEYIEAKRVYEYPNSWATYDVSVVVLKDDAPYQPRLIAMDCIADEYLVDGAEVAVVGFGNTNTQGTAETSKLREGITYIQDADGNRNQINGTYTGFNDSVSPGGELGAGGNGVDACFGDSGGPLYLLTPQGAFLTGVTSRSYAGVPNNYPCRDGGVYVRPDAVVKWIERKSGVALPHPDCNAAPSASAETIHAGPKGGTTTIEVSDPDDFNEGFTFEVAVEPEHGTVSIDADGRVTYTPNGAPQDDSFVVAVVDSGSPWEASGPESTELTIDVKASALGGCGGCNGGGTSPAWLLLGVPVLFRRRR